MAPLIEQILALEDQASKIVQAAQTTAAAVAERAEADARAERNRIDEETDDRLAAYRAHAEAKFRADETAAEAEFMAACDKLAGFSDSVLRPSVERVLNRIEED